jgi:hypothetical protein
VLLWGEATSASLDQPGAAVSPSRFFFVRVKLAGSQEALLEGVMAALDTAVPGKTILGRRGAEAFSDILHGLDDGDAGKVLQAFEA